MSNPLPVITRIETAVPARSPNLLAVRIHTDTGLVGCGETYYAPTAVAALLHDWMARRLLGADPLSIAGHWRFLYERSASFGARGCELRAISAVDLALWDILGRHAGLPVWQLLGGQAQSRVAVYNSSGGAGYGSRRTGGSPDPDCLDTVRQFRQLGGVPVAASEMYSGPDDFRIVLECGAADYVMIDPTWVGGVSQTLKITDLAGFYNIPVCMHDCTGPFTLMAGIQIGIARSNVAWQETVRSHIRMVYPDWIEPDIRVREGAIAAPPAPGLGIAWKDEVFGGEESMPDRVFSIFSGL